MAPRRTTHKAPATGRLRAVVAARISVLTDESVSIQRQVKSGEKYAALKDWPVVGYVKDEDVSATKVAPFDRPSLAAWITRSDEWDVLIFWKLDRVVRSPADLWDMVRWCDEHGKSLVFVEDNFDLSTEMGRAMATIAAVFARMEAANISARRIAANKELRTTVRWTSSRPPYPFMSVDAPDGKGKVLVRDPESYAITREIGMRVLDRQSRYSIMDDLNERGVPSPADHHRKRTGKPLKGAPWGVPTLTNILTKLSTQGIKLHSPTGNAKDAKPVIGDDGMPLRIAEPTFTDQESKEIQSRLAEAEGSHHQRTAGVASPYPSRGPFPARTSRLRPSRRSDIRSFLRMLPTLASGTSRQSTPSSRADRPRSWYRASSAASFSERGRIPPTTGPVKVPMVNGPSTRTWAMAEPNSRMISCICLNSVATSTPGEDGPNAADAGSNRRTANESVISSPL